MILNRTRKTRDRYTVVGGSMGCHGMANGHANHHYEIRNGNPSNPSGIMSVSYFLTLDYVPQEAKDNLRKFLTDRGFDRETLIRP